MNVVVQLAMSTVVEKRSVNGTCLFNPDLIIFLISSLSARNEAQKFFKNYLRAVPVKHRKEGGRHFYSLYIGGCSGLLTKESLIQNINRTSMGDPLVKKCLPWVLHIF